MERAEAPEPSPSLQGVEDARAFLMASNLNDAEKGE
jgi:hypothetical protein